MCDLMAVSHQKTFPNELSILSFLEILTDVLVATHGSGGRQLWRWRPLTSDLARALTHPPSLFSFLPQAIHSVAWHHEGKQFTCSHSDGTLTMWNVRGQGKPVQTITPHGEDGAGASLRFSGLVCRFDFPPPFFGTFLAACALLMMRFVVVFIPPP